MNALKDFNGEDIYLEWKITKAKLPPFRSGKEKQQVKTDGTAVPDSPEDSWPLSNHFRAERINYNDHTGISLQKNCIKI